MQLLFSSCSHGLAPNAIKSLNLSNDSPEIYLVVDGCWLSSVHPCAAMTLMIVDIDFDLCRIPFISGKLWIHALPEKLHDVPAHSLFVGDLNNIIPTE